MYMGRDNMIFGVGTEWTTIFGKIEDPMRGVQGGQNNLVFVVYANDLNDGNIETRFQDSPDNSTWTTRHTFAEVVPGGYAGYQVVQEDDYVRIQARCTTGTGVFTVAVHRLNPHENPALFVDGVGDY